MSVFDMRACAVALLSVVAVAVGDPGDTSYYLKHIHKGGLALEGIVPRVLTPRVKEPHPAPRADCRLVCGDGGYGKNIRPYLRAMGRLELAVAESAPLARAAAASLEAEWKKLLDLAAKPPSSPPIRVVTKHYARDGLPGRCVTIHVAFVTAPDVFLDDGGLTPELMERVRNRKIEGALVEFRKTYQLESGTPRLIEASWEVTPRIVAIVGREGLADLLKEKKLRRFAGDANVGGHFQLYGGGTRRGWAWYDLSLGRDEAEPWSAAYEIERTAGKKARVRTEPLEARLVEKLQALVERA